MFRFHVPGAGRWSAVAALVVVTGWLFASGVKGQAAPPQQAQAAKNPYVLTTDGAVLLNFVKADKTGDFEMIMGKLKEALNKSDKPERKQQAAGWKIFKSSQLAQGNAVYIMRIDPVVKGQEYDITRLIAEVFPVEVQELFAKYKEAFAGRAITELTNFMTMQQ